MQLHGIPETTLWTLYMRAVEAGRSDPEIAALRRELLPGAPNLRLIERSALDETWMDEVDPSRGVLLTAQGLLMYFAQNQVHGLIDACRRRFPGGGSSSTPSRAGSASAASAAG